MPSTADKRMIVGAREKASLSPLVCGLSVGLFLARVIAELTRAPWPPLWILTLAAVACAAAMWFAHWFERRGVVLPLVPALALLVYVFWPQRDLSVALAAATTALLAWLMAGSSRFTFHVSRLTSIDLLTFVVALGVYLATLQKDVLPADSGEFQLVVTQMGVLHQPGYPLYTLVGKLFTLLPFGAPALRLNLMSALLAAGTLTLVGATVRRMMTPAPIFPRSLGAGEGVWAGLAAALALGTSTTFWAQATTANIRMPTVFFVAWCLYQISSFKFKVSNERNLTLFALAFSLGLGHYFPLAVMGVFFVAYLVLVDPALIRQPRRWWKPLSVFALAQLVWLYLPIHAAIAPTKETAGLASPGGFLWYATGQGFEGDFLAFANLEHLPARLALLPTLFPFQMNWVLLIAALLGALLMLWRDWRAGVMLVGAFLVYTFIAITYRAPQTVEYEMPAYVVLAVMIGYAAGQFSIFNFQISNLKPQISGVLVACVLVAGLANGVVHASSFTALANDRSTREYVEPILRDAPRDAVILADWHFATPMWYLQQIENVRPDVEVRYVYPVGGQEWSQVWRGLIEENVKWRPVIVTHYWGMQYPAMPYTFEPFHQAWLVRTVPRFDAPPGMNSLSIEFDGKIRLSKFQISTPQKSGGQALKSQVEITLVWQTIGQLDHDYAFTVHLVDANGARRTQRDRGYPTGTFAPGEVRVDQFTLPLEPTLAPGKYAVQVGVYFVPPGGGFRHLLTEEGDQMATVATFDLTPSTDSLPTLHPLDVPFVGGPTLTGIDYDRSNPTTMRVYCHWRGPSPAGLTVVIGGVPVKLPEMPIGATFVTGHEVLVEPSMRQNVLGIVWILNSDSPFDMRVGAGAWGRPIQEVYLPQFYPTDRYVPLSDQMLLIGVDTPGRQVSPGQAVDVTLRYLSRRPLVANYVASVRMDGPDGAWRVASDDHPAGNAFPTLKWIAGSVVSDWRRLVVPMDAKVGRATGHLKVYDEIREEILPPLDARMGDDIPLDEWNVKR